MAPRPNVQFRYASSTTAVTERSRGSTNERDGTAWNRLITARASEGLDSLRGLVDEMKVFGTVPTMETYHALAPHLAAAIVSSDSADPQAFNNRVYALLEEWNEVVGMDADDVVGRTIIERITMTPSIPRQTAALVLSSLYYDISLQKPFTADETLSDATALVYVSWLCDAQGGNDIKAAVDAFKYFLSVYDANKNVLSAPSLTTTTTTTATPVQQMAATLLTAMAKRSRDVAKQATPLIDELRERRFTLAERDKMRVIKRLMESTVDHRDAFRMYSWIRGLNPKAFTYDQYLEIINHFADLSLVKSPRVPPELLAEFITDIKKAGRRMDAKMYTTIISRFTRFLRQRRRQLTETDLVEMIPSTDDHTVSQTLHLVRKLHGTIRLDSFLDVDVPLLNAIMDAYNQLGAWPECFTVWQELVDQHAWTPQREAYQPSLSIILDACGYSGQLERARRIWAWATRGAVPVNRNNVAAWVECLCRTAQVVEATTLLCDPAGLNDVASDLRIDKRLLELPLKFAWRHDEVVRRQVRQMIRDRFPDEWPALRFVASRSA